MKSWLQKILFSSALAKPSRSSVEERRLGNTYLDRGELQTAIECYERAAALEPESADAHISLGFALQQIGQAHAALSALAQALRLQPNDFDALYLCGQACTSLNQDSQAVAHFEKALALQPEFEPLYGELCQAMFVAGEFERARNTIDSGLVRFPNNASFHLFSGNLHFHRKDWDTASSAYKQALRLDPQLPQAHGNLATVLQQREQWSEALAHFDNAIALDSREASFHIGRSTCLFKLGLVEAALQSLLRALPTSPDSADIHQNLGFLYMQLGRRTEAEQHCRKALALNPRNANAHSNLGALQVAEGRFMEAEESFQLACDLQPSNATFISNMGGCLVRQGRLPAAIACFREAQRLDSQHVESGNNLLLALSAAPDTSAAEYVLEARSIGERLCIQKKNTYTEWPAALQNSDSRPLRVGLISAGLSNGSVGYFLEAVVAHINPARIELIAYDSGAKTDALSDRMRPFFTTWHKVFGKGTQDVAQLIHSDGIQLLIDLNGHTEGNSLPVFALKPAPVQISWLGYWASTGLPSMDFVLADSASVPYSDQNQFTERVYYMPNSRHCFAPPLSGLQPSLTPALNNGFVTFGSYQSLTKIHAGVLTVWGHVLQAIPRSRLHLTSHQVNDLAFQQSFNNKLQAAGIDPSRVTLAGPQPREQYLASYAQVDIVLDTFPYSGGTTTCEALWMGVPTLTLCGNSMIGRQGVSMLGCVGLHDWIAESEDDYVAKAKAHATDTEVLSKLRLSLRERALASPLFDAPRFAKDWEDALLAMWQIKQGSD